MWFLPTFGRPERCQATLDSIAAAGPSHGAVIVDGDHSYGELRLPPRWRQYRLDDNQGLCGVLNYALQRWDNLAWYGFLTDDSIVRTPGWSEALVKAAGPAGFANSGDGWQAQRRMHGAIAFGGDLLRALGWWAPPGLTHSYCDDAWERLARALDNWVHVPQVLVEHQHPGNSKAEADATYAKNYATFEADKAAWKRIARDEIPLAIARAAKAVAAASEAPPAAERRMRARSRSVVICTPISRAPATAYTLSLADTIVMLEREGVRHGRYFVIGSSNLPKARNELVARFLAGDATDMVFIDDDMGWQPNALLRLIASDKPLCAVAGRMRVDKPNSDPAVWCGQPVHDGQGGGLVQDEMGFVKFERVGTGFMKISRSVFEAIAAAHPDWKATGHAGLSEAERAHYYRFFRFGEDAHEGGEDFGFCEAWKALGGEIWVDVDQRLSHVGEKDYAGAFAELLKAAESEPVALRAAAE